MAVNILIRGGRASYKMKDEPEQKHRGHQRALCSRPDGCRWSGIGPARACTEYTLTDVLTQAWAVHGGARARGSKMPTPAAQWDELRGPREHAAAEAEERGGRAFERVSERDVGGSIGLPCKIGPWAVV